MTEVFISYARPTAAQAEAMAMFLREAGFGVWRDDDLPPHRPFGDVIEERLRAARAVVVLWSGDAAKSQWVRAEADMAREYNKLVQLTLDGSPLPMPFNQIQCANLIGWTGDPAAPALKKIVQSVTALVHPEKADPAGQAGNAGLAGQLSSHFSALPSHGAAWLAASGPATVAVATTGTAFPLADELATQLATALACHPALQVRSRATDPAEYLVELQARQAGGRIRATARLLVVADGAQLWCERFEGSEEELFELEDRVTELVTANVEAHVRRSRIQRTLEGSNPTTQEARISAAWMAINRMEREGYREALAALEPLLATPVSTSAEALAMAALCHGTLWANGHSGTSAADRDQAISHARRALKISDTDPFPTGLSAIMLAWCGEPVEPCIALIDRIAKLSPGFAPVNLWAGQIHLISGQLEKAASALETARRLDQRMTVRPILLGVLGAVRMLQQQHNEAFALLLEASHLQGQIPMNAIFLAATLGHLGQLEEGRAALARAEAIAPVADFRLPLLAANRAHLAAGLAALAGQAGI